MSTGEGDPTGAGRSGPSEEELRAAYEEEIRKVRVEHVLLEQVVTLINLGMRRTGLAPGTEQERDPDQVRLAVESIRALIPLLEQSAPQQIGPIRDALSQLQLAFVRIGGAQAPSESQPETGDSEGAAGEQPAATQDEPAQPSKPGEPGPAQRSGRLWVPGQ
jgi:hypothetical protein